MLPESKCERYRSPKRLSAFMGTLVRSRETQKAIILGEKGKMIRELGTKAREEIEKFLQRKVFLELFVKVREKWRDNEIYLKEFGY